MLQRKNDPSLQAAFRTDEDTAMRDREHDKVDIDLGSPPPSCPLPSACLPQQNQQQHNNRRSVSCERSLRESSIIHQQHAALHSSPKLRSRHTFTHHAADKSTADKSTDDKSTASDPPGLPTKRIRRSISSDGISHDLDLHFHISSPAMHFLPRQNRQLQLPSFEELGIASSSQNNTMAGAQPSMSPSGSGSGSGSFIDASVARSPSKTSSPFADSPNSRMDVSFPSPLPITPPETDDHVRWNPGADHAGPLSDTTITGADLSGGAEQRINGHPVDTCTPGQAQQNNTDHPGGGDYDSQSSLPISSRPVDDENHPQHFLQKGISIAVSKLTVSKNLENAVQVVSQTLPCPPAVGLPDPDTLSPSCIFTPIVQAIQARLQPDQSPYIKITHAVPPKTSLASLPTSPPSTPNHLSPGGDYFNMTVFSNATAAPNYPYISTPSTSLVVQPPPPHVPTTPIVPPFSVNIAAIERYLPPTSTDEYQNLFTTQGPSVLLDRLRELSPRNGSLVLIYPTLRGAQSFKQHHLNPILDPLLRQLVVLNCLPSDIGSALGSTPAIRDMDCFETMCTKVTSLCASLTGQDRTSFTLAYAASGCIPLSRTLWTEWYLAQEVPRAREILDDYWRNDHRNRGHTASKGRGMDREVTSSMVLREIIDGMRKRALTEPPVDTEQRGVEVGIFVIQRSQTSQR